MKQTKWYTIIACIFVAVLLISNITSTKLVVIGPFTFDAGTLLFPLAYIFGDILTEVYGYRETRKVIWTGLICSLLMAALIMFVGWLPAAGDWPFQDAYMNVLGLTPRIVLASAIAYIAGEFSNALIVAKMKVRDQGKALWKRFLGSTIIGQGLDTVIFILIAFAGIFPWSVIWTIVISNYVFKILIEILLLPLTYKIVSFLKKEEGLDVFDETVSFSMFR